MKPEHQQDAPEAGGPSGKGSMRIEGAKIGVARQERRRKWLGAAALGIPLALLLIGLLVQRRVPAPGEHFVPSHLLPIWWRTLLWTGVASTFASLAAWWASLLQSGPFARKKAALELNEDNLEINTEAGAESIALAEIDHVVELRNHDQELVAYLRDGRQLTIRPPTRQRFELLGALRRGVERHAGRVAIGSLASKNAFTRTLAWFVFLSATLALATSIAMLGDYVGAGRALTLTDLMWPLGFGGLAATLWQTLRRRSIVVGRDGVRLGRLRSRFIGYGELLRVKRKGSQIRLYCEDGKVVRLPSLFAGNDLVLRIRKAKQAFDDAAAAAPLAAITRGSRNADEWQAALRKVTEPGYRVGAVHSDRLIRILDDPAADPEQRVGAALALTAKEEPRKRIRIAAQACAEPAMRRALEAAAEGELADDELQRANERFERAKAQN